jgi:hypothetical protein
VLGRHATCTSPSRGVGKRRGLRSASVRARVLGLRAAGVALRAYDDLVRGAHDRRRRRAPGRGRAAPSARAGARADAEQGGEAPRAPLRRRPPLRGRERGAARQEPRDPPPRRRGCAEHARAPAAPGGRRRRAAAAPADGTRRRRPPGRRCRSLLLTPRSDGAGFRFGSDERDERQERRSGGGFWGKPEERSDAALEVHEEADGQRGPLALDTKDRRSLARSLELNLRVHSRKPGPRGAGAPRSTPRPPDRSYPQISLSPPLPVPHLQLQRGGALRSGETARASETGPRGC